MPQDHRSVRAPITARGEATRQRLLEAAERLFGEKGYHNTSVVDITREAAVGHGTFYLYFPTKEAIFAELVRHLSHSLRSAIREATRGLQDRLEVERVGLLAFFRFVAAHRNLYKIVRESEFVDPELSRWYYRRLAKGYAAGLAQAMQAGQIRSLDPEALTYCLMGMAYFLGMRWIVWEGRVPPDEAIQTLLTLMESGLRPDSKPGSPNTRRDTGDGTSSAS